MRIYLINGGPLAGWLSREGFEITSERPDYTVEILKTDTPYLRIKTGNTDLEVLLIDKLRELGQDIILLDKTDPLSDKKVTLSVPSENKIDIERGVFRALVVHLTRHPIVPWYKRIIPIIFFLLLTESAYAQDGMTFIQLWTSSGPVYAADYLNNAMRVNIVGSAGFGTSSAFGAAFPANGTAAGFISSTGTMAGGNLDASGSLKVTQTSQTAAVTTGNITTTGAVQCPGTGCVEATTNGGNTVAIEITGVWAGTLLFQGKTPSGAYVGISPLPTDPAAAPQGQGYTGSNGFWRFNSTGFTAVRIYANTLTLSPATVNMQVSQSYFDDEMARFTNVTATLNAACIDPCVTPPGTTETAGSTIKIQMRNRKSVSYYPITVTAWDPGNRAKFETSIDGIYWTQVAVAVSNHRSNAYGVPVGFVPVVGDPGLVMPPPGTNFFRIRMSTYVGGSAQFVTGISYVDSYVVGLHYTSWDDVPPPQRSVAIGAPDTSATCDGGPCFHMITRTANALNVNAVQGTAAASTAPWPVTGGTVAAVTAAWTSATPVDTTLPITVSGYGQVICTINIVGAVTGGVLLHEMDNGSGTFYPTDATTVYSAAPQGPTTAASTSLALGTSQINKPVVGYSAFRVRLNPIIVGAGTANIRCTAGALPSPQSVAVNQVFPGGAAANLGKVEDAAHTSGDTGVQVLGVVIDPTATESVGANTRYGSFGIDRYGALFEGRHPNSWSCFVPLTAVATTECKAVAAAGFKNYVTSFYADNGAATVQTVDVVYGTGANCVTGTTAITHKFQMGTNATTTSPDHVQFVAPQGSPLTPAVATAICCRPGAATAFGCTITGYTAR